MEILRQMFIRGDGERLDELMEEVTRNLPEGWSRDRASEVAREYHGNKPGRYHFHSEGGDRFPACDLILLRLGPSALGVATIIPHDDDRFTVTEHNAVLEEFGEKIAHPCVERLGMSIELTPGRFDLRLWLSEIAAEKLMAFSRSAHKGVGGALPVDQDRWLDFVVSAHREGCRMPEALLRRWLIEVEGWYPDDAERLTGQYAFGEEVLAYSDRQTA